MHTNPPQRLSIGRKLLFALVAFVVFLLILEGVARLLERTLRPDTLAARDEAGWQTTFFRSIFDWNQPDPELLWRFKPNLDSRLIKTNAEGLIAGDITLQKPAGTVRIMVLGDSSPAGLGLQSRSETFADILRRRLSAYLPSTLHLEMINASVPGYTSEQIRRFMEIDGWSYQPDLLIVYCGNNDASISGPLSDEQLLERERMAGLRRALGHLALYRLLRSAIESERGPGHTPANQPLRVRVSPKRYGANLTVIADEASRRGVPLIVLEPPVPLLWPAGLQFNIFKQINLPDGQLLLPPRMIEILGRDLEYCLNPVLTAYIYGSADPITRAVLNSAFSDSLPPAQASVYWADRCRNAPDNPVAWNNAGVSDWRDTQYVRADSLFSHAEQVFRDGRDSLSPENQAALAPFVYNRGINALSESGIDTISVIGADLTAYRWLDSALQCDYFSLRIKRLYRNQLRKLGESGSATVVDLKPLFNANGGERLFLDHCHPDAIGHRLIADTLLPHAVELLGWSGSKR